jgi:SNF2 family DNA or RNA helicase
VDPYCLGLNVDSNKIKFVQEYLQDNPNESIIIVSAFVKPLIHLKEVLKDYKTELMIGDTSAKQRQKIKEEFQNNKIQIILGNIQVIKEGLQLDKASTIIFLDSSLTYTDNLQTMDRFVPTTENRIHKEKQQVIRLISKGTVDEYLETMLYKEKASSADIINNYTKGLKTKHGSN